MTNQEIEQAKNALNVMLTAARAANMPFNDHVLVAQAHEALSKFIAAQETRKVEADEEAARV